MKLEEYILKRKIEDGLNEFDVEKKVDNIRICINYIFEYFNNYLDEGKGIEITLLHNEKIEKYRNMIREYDPEVREWLIELYSSHGKYMHSNLRKFVTDTYFLLYDSDSDFRALSYDLYPKMIKKYKFLEGHSEMIFLFLKDVHKVESMWPQEAQESISEVIDEWIDDTYRKKGVNIYSFCSEWIEYFFEHPDIWPKGHKKQGEYYYLKEEYSKMSSRNRPNESMYWDYDYRQKNNLFGLDHLYQKMPKKSFTRGKKQEFEAVLLYIWSHDWDAAALSYWDEYSSKCL